MLAQGGLRAARTTWRGTTFLQRLDVIGKTALLRPQLPVFRGNRFVRQPRREAAVCKAAGRMGITRHGPQVLATQRSFQSSRTTARRQAAGGATACTRHGRARPPLWLAHGQGRARKPGAPLPPPARDRERAAPPRRRRRRAAAQAGTGAARCYRRAAWPMRYTRGCWPKRIPYLLLR